jgi:transmembrane sensor
MQLTDYHRYQFEDFIEDRLFRAEVRSTGFDAFRAALLAAYPEKTSAIDDAAFVIRHLDMQTDHLPDESRQRIWQVLAARQETLPASSAPARTTRRWFALAAMVTALLLALAGWWLRRTSAPAPPPVATVRTGFGETRQLILPDGSTVLLNGNSQLTYTLDAAAANVLREVWLQGEAFFHVQPRTGAYGAVRFVVHSPDLDVEVLGTEFNVNTRRGKTQVVLMEGRVRLIDPKRPASQARVVEMKPGEMATHAPDRREAEVRPADAERVQAWTQQKFIYDDTPLRDVALELEDTYGLHVAFADAQLGDLRLTANLSNQDLETLLVVIEATFNLKLEKNAGRIMISRHTRSSSN